MRVILIDDEELALEFLETLLSKIDGIEIVGKFTDPELAYEKLRNLFVDVIFLDMEMGNLHGLDFAEKVMGKHNEIEIIFVTAYPQYALEAFEVNAIDYLLKPVRLNRLEKALLKVEKKLALHSIRRQVAKQINNTVYVHAMGSFRLLDFDHHVVKWRTRKAKELFTYLWHHQNNPVHKTRVIEELWPDLAVDKATTLLHTTIYQLRQTLRKIGIDQSVKLVNDQYVLTVDIASDVKELAEIQAEKVNRANIERALLLYTGDYLAEDGYPWMITKQQQLTQSFLFYLEKATNGYLNKYDDTLLFERCLEKMIQCNQTNEAYLTAIINYYGEIGESKKLTELAAMITMTFETDLEMSVPLKIKNLLHKYVNY